MEILPLRESIVRTFLVLLLLLAGGRVLAEPVADPRLAALQMAFDRVQMEQQATYQQFLMAQEMRRNELQEATASSLPNYAAMDAAGPVDYDANIRRMQARQERLQRYEQDIDRVYAHYLELGNQKKALLDQIIELSRPPTR